MPEPDFAIREILLVNPEYWALESGIPLKELRNSTYRLESGIQVPLAKNRNSVPGIRNPRLGIQDPRLSWIPLHGATSFFYTYWKCLE